MVVDIIITVLAQILILISSIILYVVLTAKTLPGIILKPKYDMSSVCDRGIKRYVFDGGRAITYEPCTDSKKYIKQYILSDNGGEKFIKCKIDERIMFMRYTVAAFDSNDNMIDLIRVDDRIVRKGFGKGIMLPSNTSYACVTVNEVNSIVVNDGVSLQLPLLRVGVFVAITTALSLAEGMTINYIVLSIAKLILGASLSGAGFGGVVTFAIIGVVLSVLITLLHCSKRIKIRL